MIDQSQHQDANSSESSEERALENIADELAKKIFELAKGSCKGDLLCLHIRPSYENFGSVAQLRVVNKIKPGPTLLSSPRNQGPAAMDEETFKSDLLSPAIQRARAGCLPQPLPLKLQLGDELFSATMELYVGIRKTY